MDTQKLAKRIEEDLESIFETNKSEVVEQIMTTLSDLTPELTPEDVFDKEELDTWAEENGWQKEVVS